MLRSHFTTAVQWLRRQAQQLWCSLHPQGSPVGKAVVVSGGLGHLSQRPREQLPPFVQSCAVARHYLGWLGRLDWQQFPERSGLAPTGQRWRGPRPQASAPFVAALLIKVDRQLPHMADLRHFLVEHPALTWVLGFPLIPSSFYPWGFDVEASLPSHHHFTRLLRTLPNASLQFLLANTIHLIEQELPDTSRFGDEISLDTKHILAWVRENNPKEFIRGGRFHKEKQPKGDKDCRVGFKAHSNQSKGRSDAPSFPPTPTTEAKPASQVRPGDYFWGYASGAVATKVSEWGEFVLAELTQSLNNGDVSYFFPLMQAVEQRLGRRPRFAALDAAFDAFYVYEYFHPNDPTQPGFAAVPLRDDDIRSFDPAGLPLCEAGLPMPLKSTYLDRTHLFPHPRGRHACPLLFPQANGQTCPIAHKTWPKGGCLTTLPTSIGTRIRAQLDRKGVDFQRIYRQRTATERIFSQAVEAGMERPKLRNYRSIANQNTLIYILINLYALDRVLHHKDQPLPPTAAARPTSPVD